MCATGRGGPPAGLEQWLASPEGQRKPHRVHVVDLPGGRVVIKRRPGEHRRGADWLRRYLRVVLIAALCGLCMGEFPAPAQMMRIQLDLEAERLRRLRGQGARVPAVLWEERGMLVLEYVGGDLQERLRELDPPGRIALMRRAGADLAAFHQAGYSHGGAQLRNMTLHQGDIWRIDFEENTEALSLPLGQAYDVLQMVLSAMVLQPLPGSDPRDLGRAGLLAYLEAGPAPAVMARLRRAAGIVSRLQPLHPLARLLPMRDVQGYLRMTEVIRLLLSA